MRILAVGDVCSIDGCKAALHIIPRLKRERQIDLVIANGENSAEGNGITSESAEMLFSAGADIITGGNHTLRRREVHETLDEHPYMLRPDNIQSDYGKGYCLYDMGKCTVAVINLLGQVYLDAQKAQNPFLAADELINRAKAEGAHIILVDFHAEATSEKRALGFYLDGKVSAVFGTHTHVQTADAQILPGGTGYITDLGMTGVIDSILGVKKEIIIARLKSADQSRFEQASGESMLCGCIFDIDEKSGRALRAEAISIK